jgi:hypothetical protein
MEKCSNCGGAVRPGAKFCTSCGTRLNNDPAPEQSGWSQGASAQETQVAAATPAVRPNETAPSAETAPESTSREDGAAESTQFSTWRHSNSSWGAASDTTPSSTSPADRFEAALDAETAGTPETEEASPQRGSLDWGKPAAAAPESTEDRFASWAAAYASTSDDNAVESATITPAPTGTPADEPSSPSTDMAGFNGSNEREIDVLSGDENIATVGQDFGITAGTPADLSDVRQRATSLVEELRGLIWKIGEPESVREGDTSDALSDLTSVRGQTSDFSDLERVIADVRDSPKDVDALRELGKQAGRLESLLESHASLTAAVDDAIRKLR